MIEPAVDVIMPTYNHGAFIAEAIDSVLGQDYANLRLTVVDDGSTDNTDEVLARYGDRIAVLRQHRQFGAAARNAAIARSTGEFIAEIDADDVWVPGMLRRHMAVLAQCGDVSLVFGRARLISEAGDDLGSEIPTDLPGCVELEPVPSLPSAYALTGDVALALLTSNFIPHTGVVLRRAAIEAVGGFDPEQQIAYDHDLWLRMVLDGSRCAFVDDVAYLYRQRDALPPDVRAAHAADRIRLLRKTCERRDELSSEAVDLAEARIAGAYKLRGDLLVTCGDLKEARRMYAQAIRFGARPIQLASWALSWLGPAGAAAIRSLNRGSDAFATPTGSEPPASGRGE